MRTEKFKLITYQNIDIDERNVLTLLYQPIIGCKAFSLYTTLWSLIDRSRLKSPEYTHRKLFDLLSLNQESFTETRRVLEAIGLLVVYQNEDLYLYELKAPVSAEEFIKHGSLGAYLYNKIGKTEFEEISNLFRVTNQEKTGYKNITASFDDVFKAINDDIEIEDNYISRSKPKITMKHQFDFELFVEGLSKNYVDKRRLTKKVKDQIIHLSFIYSLDEIAMQKAFMDSVDNDKSINFDRLVKRCKYWASILKQTKDQIEEYEQKEINYTYVKEICRTSEPVDILGELTGHKATNKERETLLNAMTEFELDKDVFNYLIIYAFGQANENGGRKLLPTFSYLEAIYTSWARQGVKTIDDAHNLALKFKDEIKTNKKTPNRKAKRNEPDWVDDVMKEL